MVHFGEKSLCMHFGEYVWPTTVSLLLESEPIEVNQKFKFLVEGIVVWKFLKVSTASGSASV